MQLKAIKLKNFRGYKEEVLIPLHRLTAFIGKNDAGKSTVLEALAVFFGEQDIDCNDAHVKSKKKPVSITCVFGDLPKSVVLDSEGETNFKDEYLVRRDGLFEIEKTFNCGLQKPKMTGVYVLANHPCNPGVSALHTLNQDSLKEKLQELNIEIEGVDMRSNPKMRKRIWESTKGLEFKELKFRIDTDETKGVNNIWQELKRHLPAFALFKSDRESTDQDGEAKDPMAAAIKEAIKSQEKELANVTMEVERQVRIIADATIEKMREMNPGLANVLKPTIMSKKWDTLFSVSLSGDEEVPINKRGSGFRRLVLLNFFRAKAEKHIQEENLCGVIYAFEEPETSQHPDNQRMLMKALLELSTQDGCQVLLSTHTPALGDLLPVESVRYLELLNDGTRTIHLGDKATYEKVIKALGVLPDNRVKVFVAVEGPNDIDFLKGISATLHNADTKLPDLGKMEAEGALIFIPLGGGNLKIWASRLANLNRPEFHLYDRDLGQQTLDHQAAAAEVNKRPGCQAVLTSKREIENYLHPDAILKALKVTVTFGDTHDVPTLVAEQLHIINGSVTPWNQLTEKEQKRKASAAKRRLCNEVVAQMDEGMISASDTSNDFRGWLTTIARMAAG